MPTRKQRRKRQKDLRHQYEFVYVDESGRELDVDPEPADDRSSRRNGKRDAKKPAQKSRNARSAKPASPPSWQRVGKRALLFAPLIFVAFSVINSHQALIGRIAVTAVYTAFFVPFMYLMDRAMYRSYLRRTGQQLPASGLRRKR